MSPINETRGADKLFWRSLDDLADTERFRRFVEREFPEDAERMMAPASRRGFMKLMGASMALAGMTGCRWPTEEILPFAHRPDGYVPGVPRFYATAMELGGVATGLLAKSYDGRPIKLEGNPEHPSSLGSTSAIAQAALLELYDPERSRAVKHAGRPAPGGWDEFATFAHEQFGALKADGGMGLRVVSEATSSPSVAAMRRRFEATYPQARWCEYEPLSRDNQREGSTLAFGAPHRTHLALDQAELILSLDEDFVLDHPAAVRYARDHVTARDPDGGLESRLYMVESGFSVTGTMADDRIPLPAKLLPVAAGCFAAELFLEVGVGLPGTSSELTRIFERFQFHPLYTDLDWSFAREFANRRGRCLIVAGPSQPPEVHALVHLMNHALGNVGKTVHYTADPEPNRPSHVAAIRELRDEIDAGQVDTLVVLGGNPAFDAPADLGFERLLGKVKTTIHLGHFENETAQACTWHLPRSHFLESWGDARDYRGTVSVIQPLIEPLAGGKSVLELLSILVDDAPEDGHAIVRRTISALAQSDSDSVWRKSLHDGLLAGSEWPEVKPVPRVDGWSDPFKPLMRARAEMRRGFYELRFRASSSLYDGRFANNGWLQELPDALTKLTWDNAALMSLATAAELGVEHGDRVSLEAAGRSVELPVYVLPGHAIGTISVQLGYGRRSGGDVGIGVGVDVYPLRTSDAMHNTMVAVKRARGSHDLATTQDHFAIDVLGKRARQERIPDLIRDTTLEELRGHVDHDGAGHAGPHSVKLWESPVEYDGYKWGMAIDMNACVGCNACVLACQAENNIPVVGKDEVGRGREMHWIRIDRYFSGEPEAPTVTHQPVTCQHCENAPCEQVCPVAATVHDHEGLNLMIYNRCVGTRYCSNNCPYKVRRFNYFNNHNHETAMEALIHNPEVTKRNRGVMEKCTFCIQRINAAKITAKNDGRQIQDGEITTACEQACPTRAISFGNLNDPESRVRRKHDDRRAYGLLEEWNFRPRNKYLSRVRNPDPRKPGGVA